MSRSHFSRTQLDIIDDFEAGNIQDVEFVELAMDAGMSIPAMEEVLREHRIDPDELIAAGTGGLK